jgi:ankyrin repeat protein
VERISELKDPQILFILLSGHNGQRSLVDEYGTLLHMVCSSDNVNKSVVQALLDKAGPELALVQDQVGQTALHNAFISGAPLDVIQLLTSAVRIQDDLHRTPLDHVCERIIMREVGHRYDEDEYVDATDLFLWECAQLMLQALGPPTIPVNQLMMHACVRAGSLCPLALRHRVMKRYAHQLDTPDDFGNLPLHIAASLSVSDDEEDVEEIQQVLTACPTAIQVANIEGKLPLDVAIDAGRTWRSGVRTLFEAFPEAIVSKDIPITYYPMILSEIGADSFFRVAKATPELFQGTRR